MKTKSELLKDFAVDIEKIQNEFQDEIDEINSKENVSNADLIRSNTLKEVVDKLENSLNKN